MIIPRLVLFLFVAFECFLAWSGRFLPRRDRSTAFFNGLVAAILASAATGGIVAEVFLYRSLTGQVTLRDDNFWFAVMIIQGLIVIPLAINSGSVLKRK